MAQIDSLTYTAQAAVATSAANMVSDAALTSGKVSFLQCRVLNSTGALSASDTIQLGYVPSGMTVVPGLITITTTVTGGSGTFKIGTVADDDAITGSVNAVANTVGTAVLNTSVASVAFAARTLLVATQVGALADAADYVINIPLVNSN